MEISDMAEEEKEKKKKGSKNRGIRNPSRIRCAARLFGNRAYGLFLVTRLAIGGHACSSVTRIQTIPDEEVQLAMRGSPAVMLQSIAIRTHSSDWAQEFFAGDQIDNRFPVRAAVSRLPAHRPPAEPRHRIAS
jgi:hypothetical protein